jgi:hypothetical protein
VSYVPQPRPPEVYANPYAAAAVTMDMIRAGVKCAFAVLRRRREMRRLDRIAILPPDWDVAGRHCEHL